MQDSDPIEGRIATPCVTLADEYALATNECREPLSFTVRWTADGGVAPFEVTYRLGSEEKRQIQVRGTQGVIVEEQGFGDVINDRVDLTLTTEPVPGNQNHFLIHNPHDFYVAFFFEASLTPPDTIVECKDYGIIAPGRTRRTGVFLNHQQYTLETFRGEREPD